MELHIRNITRALRDWIEDECITQENAVYRGFSLLAASEPAPDLIHIFHSWEPKLPGFFPEACIFCYSEHYRASTAANRILIKADISCFLVIARLEEVFRRYNDWAESLNESLLQGRGVKALLDISLPIFQNPIFLMDLDYSIAFLSDVPGGISLASVYGNDFVEGQTIPESLVQIFERSECYLQAMTPHQTFCWEDPGYPGKFLTNSTEDMGLVLSNCNQEFREGDEHLLSYLMKAVTQSIHMHNLYPRFSINDMRQIIIKALSKDSFTDRESLHKLAQGIGWNVVGTYYVCLVHLSYHDLIRKAMLYYCHQIENLLSYAKAFVVEDHIVILLNMSQTPPPIERHLNRLEDFLSDHNLSAGLSNLFTDFYQLQPYLHQADAALEAGLAQKCKSSLYRFEDFALAHLLSNARGGLQIEQLLPDGLKRLMEHDQQFHTAYVTVLRTYLENKCNIADSIRVLCIHRNTFLYQFEKIKEILAMDLNDVDIRLWLLITLRLLVNKD